MLIHNAPFDIAFLNQELLLTRQGWEVITHYCAIVDTLQIARQLHVGQRNSLDALCKRYTVDNSKRDLHGALLDAFLLAQVYLAMTGGQGSFFETPIEIQVSANDKMHHAFNTALQAYHLIVLSADTAELALHQQYLDFLQKQQGKCLWT